MSNVTLTLGGVPFRDMEVPEKISFGGKQRLAVQNLIGGGRVVHAMGLDDGEIAFGGIFSGHDAVQRSQLLDAARALGASLPLVWDGYFFTVIIASFTAEYQKPNLIPFSIICTVVNDPLAALAALAAPLASLVGADLTAAAALSGQAGLSLSGLSATSLAGFSTVQATLSSALQTGGASINSAGAELNGATDAQMGSSSVNKLTAALSQSAGLSGMSGYISRAAKNMAAGLS